MPPKNYNHKNINFAFGFFGTCGHHILVFFCSFEVYFIIFRFKLVNLKKYPTNIYKFDQMKYICVKINTPQSMKNYKYILKLRLWVEFCNEFFCGE
jgi:hypothetical protein